MDLCFIIDSSGSIRDSNPSDGSFDNWQLQLNFLAELVDSFTIGQDATRVGAVSFSDIVIFEFALDEFPDAESVKNAILSIDYIGQITNTAGGFRVAREQCFNRANGDRPDVQNLAVIITDGQPFPTNNVPLALEEARRLQGAGVTMTSIGVTNVINEDLLRQFSSPPQELNRNYFTAPDFTYLESIRANVRQESCESVAGKEPRGVKRFSSALTLSMLHVQNAGFARVFGSVFHGLFHTFSFQFCCSCSTLCTQNTPYLCLHVRPLSSPRREALMLDGQVHTDCFASAWHAVQEGPGAQTPDKSVKPSSFAPSGAKWLEAFRSSFQSWGPPS